MEEDLLTDYGSFDEFNHDDSEELIKKVRLHCEE